MIPKQSSTIDQKLKTLHQQYTAGNTARDALNYSAILNANGIRTILSSLGEKSRSIEQATSKAALYCDLLRGLDGINGTVSIKPSDIVITLNPELAEQNLEDILICAKETGKVIEIDMEFRSMLNQIIVLCQSMISRGFSLCVALQSGMINAIELETALIARANTSSANLSFRIVTGSCYAKSGNGYITTLETPFKVTDRQFYNFVDISAKRAKSGYQCSAIGTGVIERINYAAQEGLELQFLKGPEGDAINAVLTAAGHNLRLLEKWLRLLFILLLAAFIQIHIRQSIRIIKHTPA